MHRINLGEIRIDEKQKEAINNVLNRNWITDSGIYTKLLEKKFAEYIGTKHAIACTNGTVALMLALQAFKYSHKFRNEKPNVAVPALTFPATANAPLLIGYNVILCDVMDSICIGPDVTIDINDEFIEKNDIEVIIPVHLFGYPCDMDNIMRLKEKYNLLVLEDCAEACGSKHNVRKVGSIGDAGCFSFYASHNISAGELGMVTTNDDKLAELMRSIKNHGRTGSNLEFKHDYIGGNFKTTEFCSALLYCQMDKTDEIITKRQNNVVDFIFGIYNGNLNLFWHHENVSYLGYPVMAKDEEYKKYILKKLKDANIETREMFPCLKNQKAYEGMFKGEYPVADDFEKKGFYLPVHQYLTEEDKKRIIDVMNDGN